MKYRSVLALLRRFGRGALSAWVIAGVLLACGHSLAGEPEWVVLDENPLVSDFYYDKSTVSRSPQGVVTVWTRAVYSEQGKADALEILGKGKGYEKLSHTAFLYEINCPGGLSLLKQVIHYNDEGEKISEFNLAGKTEWEKIDPDTRMGVLQEEVCAPEGKGYLNP